MALVIKNAIIAGTGHSFRKDVLIDGEKIAAVGSAIHASGAEVLDAAGKYLLPGGIDLNVSSPMDLSCGRDSAAALFGGTTTACAPQHISCGHQEIKGCHIDLAPRFSFSGAGIRDGLSLPDTSACFAGASVCLAETGYMSDSELFAIAAAAAETGAPLMCRCENGAVADGIAETIRKQRNADISMWGAKIPAYAEAEAVHRALTIARAAGAAVYISDISAAEAVDEIISARRCGQTVYAETCPHYLLLTEELYHSTDAPLFTTSPPLRSRRDCERLWKALAQGDIDCVSSYHRAIRRADKTYPEENIFACPSGMPGIETRMALLFSEGVMKNRITLERFAAVTAGIPAAFAGLSCKGEIAPGMDADLILIDPSMKTVISAAMLHQASDYTPYEGMELNGLITDVWLRGRRQIENRALTDQTARGRLLTANSAVRGVRND